jgi:hypothetical protein
MQKNGRRASRSEAEGNLFDAMPLWLPEGAWKVAGGEGSVATGNHRMKDTQHSRTGVPEGCWKAASALSPYVIRMVFNMAPLEHFSILLLVRFHPVMGFLIQDIGSDFFEAGCTCFVECSCRNGNGGTAEFPAPLQDATDTVGDFLQTGGSQSLRSFHHRLPSKLPPGAGIPGGRTAVSQNLSDRKGKRATSTLEPEYSSSLPASLSVVGTILKTYCLPA